MEITQLSCLKTMLRITKCVRGKEAVSISNFHLGNALSPPVPWTCSHTIASAQQVPHRPSFTPVCAQLRGLPGTCHCLHFILDSLHLGTTVTERSSQIQLFLSSQRRQLFLTAQCLTKRNMHCPTCPQFLVSENHLWQYLLYVKHRQN